MSDNQQQDLQVVFCDMCTEDDRKPARKTCMKCEISMCVQHLQAHMTTPVLLQTHPLTEPMALCGTSKCPQHGKLLEYYCLDDMTCVCVSCAIEDQHRLHNMKTFSSAHKELLEKIVADQQALEMKTGGQNMSLEKWDKSEREKRSHCSVRLIEAATNLRDIALTSVQSSVSARLVSIRTSKSSMEAAHKEKDTFRFLQMYSQVHQDLEKAKAVDLRKGLEPGSDRDRLVQEIRQGREKIMKQADRFWCSLLTLVDPQNHTERLDTGSDLIFDHEVWGAGMSMSKDNRKVFYNTWMGECDATLLVCNIKSGTKCQRWVVKLSADCDWTIGLCERRFTKSFRSGRVYALCCKGEEVSCLTGKAGASFPQIIRHQGKKGDVSVRRPETVEVCWNSVASSLSFFSRPRQHQREEIITIQMSINDWDPAPFIQLGKENNSNTIPNTLRGYTQPSSIQRQGQVQWNCLCGRMYTDYTDGQYVGGSFLPKSSQTTCSCGRLISGKITEVLCELV